MSVETKAVLEGVRMSEEGGVLTYFVKNLEGDDHRKMAQAMRAPGIQQLNEPHPQFPGVKVIRPPTVTRMAGSFACFVEVEYGTNEASSGSGGDQGEIEIESNIQAIRTQLDYGGVPIEVIYNPQGNVGGGFNRMCSPGQGDRCMGAEVEQYVGLVTYRVTREENAIPLANALLMVGKLNSKGFVYGNDKEAWLCTRIASRRPLPTGKPITTYEFQWTEDGWHRIAAYIEPTSGRPPHKAIGKIELNAVPPRVRLPNDTANQDKSQNGLTIVRVQGSADFSALNLPLP